jgi:hypothetical protein
MMKGFWYGLIAILATSVLLLAQPTLTQQQRVNSSYPGLHGTSTA